MSALSVHLRKPDDHSALPFHPSCPICRRDRLTGTLAGDELLSRRTRAAIAVGLLAFSAVGAPVAVAAGPDEEVDGSGEVFEGADPASVELGDATMPMTDAGPAASDVSGPADGESDVAGVEALPDDRAAVEIGEPPIEPVAEVSEPADDPAPTSEPVVPAAPPAEAPAVMGAPQQSGAVGPLSDGSPAKRTPRGNHAEQSVQRPGVAAPVPATAPATAEAAVARAVVRVASGASSGRATAGDRFHVVQRGESLWSISADLLGERAGVARVAREVHRLWTLNEDRIASGSPDLLYAGTRLRLR